MNGWEMLYEALRFYPTKPECAICRDFLEWLSPGTRIVGRNLVIYAE